MDDLCDTSAMLYQLSYEALLELLLLSSNSPKLPRLLSLVSTFISKVSASSKSLIPVSDRC